MTDRSAEQAPVETRPQGADSRQDTARIPLAERLQRRIAAADDRRSNGANGSHGSHGSNGQSSARVLPPMPAELAQQQTEERALRVRAAHGRALVLARCTFRACVLLQHGSRLGRDQERG